MPQETLISGQVNMTKRKPKRVSGSSPNSSRSSLSPTHQAEISNFAQSMAMLHQNSTAMARLALSPAPQLNQNAASQNASAKKGKTEKKIPKANPSMGFLNNSLSKDSSI